MGGVEGRAEFFGFPVGPHWGGLYFLASKQVLRWAGRDGGGGGRRRRGAVERVGLGRSEWGVAGRIPAVAPPAERGGAGEGCFSLWLHDGCSGQSPAWGVQLGPGPVGADVPVTPSESARSVARRRHPLELFTLESVTPICPALELARFWYLASCVVRPPQEECVGGEEREGVKPGRKGAQRRPPRAGTRR